MPTTKVVLAQGPLGPAEPWQVAGAGAVVCFEGVVRPLEEGAALQGLAYEVYEPMTTRQLEELARTLVDEHGLLGIIVEHSVGVVNVGQVSFRLRVASRHRAEGLTAMGAFIDRMKQEVALWKVPLWQTGHACAGGAG